MRIEAIPEPFKLAAPVPRAFARHDGCVIGISVLEIEMYRSKRGLKFDEFSREISLAPAAWASGIGNAKFMKQFKSL